jgi:hypothetical protein
MLDADLVKRMLLFEQQKVLPLVDQIGATAVRRQDPITLVPGDIVFLANNADGHELQGDCFTWRTLSVMYCDDNDQKGEVFCLSACYDNGRLYLDAAEINGVMRLSREHDLVVWRNPLDGRRLLTFRGQEPDTPLVNAWYLFRSVILPMLYQRTYRFVPAGADAVLFQERVLRLLRAAWEKR